MTSVLLNCKNEQQVDVERVAEKFKEYSRHIDKVEYRIQRIDTFQNGKVWNNTGVALIERDDNDETFGFSFYGKRDDIPKEYIYDKGIGFEISKSAKTYQTFNGHYGVMGSPGGQMIPQNLFYLDSVYKSRTLIENEERFILKYEYFDDTVYNATEITKSIELTKDNFFPVKITRTSKVLGNRSFNQTILTNVKLNKEVQNSIKGYKDAVSDYETIQREESRPNRLLSQQIPTINLPHLSTKANVKIAIGRLTLIDFWQPWCGPCIASFPKIENLKNKYSSRLEVIGIVSDDSVAAAKLIDKKGITFLNLIGNKNLLREFSVDSWPRYFLIDEKGIMLKEYSVFSEQIEKDIKRILD